MIKHPSLMVVNSISSDRFNYKAGTFSQEASSIKDFNCYQRIYNDACDVGFGIRSEKTEKVEVFYFSEEVVENEDVAYWIFKPVDRKLNCTVKIWND